MTVRVQRDGVVTVVSIDRPGVRNAVDRATADALAEAFRAFDNDAEASYLNMASIPRASTLGHA